MIALIDYGLGNIKAFATIYKRLGVEVILASCSSDLKNASKIILPGVGAFDWAMKCLTISGMREALDEEVIGNKKPILGVCVGMQIMGKKSEEGEQDGLGWIDAEVVKFDIPNTGKNTRLPHMGWNEVKPTVSDPIWAGIDNSEFYFLHSYFFKPKFENDAIAVTNYGLEFTSAVKYENIYGTQFHPEKSHGAGVNVLKNFSEL